MSGDGSPEWLTWGGLLTFLAVVVLAVNNPSEADFKKFAQEKFDEAVDSNRTESTEDAIVAGLASAFAPTIIDNSLSIERTNFVVGSLFRVRISGLARAAVQEPARCLIGVLKRFFPCPFGERLEASSDDPTDSTVDYSPPVQQEPVEPEANGGAIGRHLGGSLSPNIDSLGLEGSEKMLFGNNTQDVAIKGRTYTDESSQPERLADAAAPQSNVEPSTESPPAVDAAQ